MIALRSDTSNKRNDNHSFGIISNSTRAKHRRHIFWCTLAVAEAFGIAAAVAIGLCSGIYDHNIDSKTGDEVYDNLTKYPAFDWHPLLMSIGMIFLLGQALLFPRLFHWLSKRTVRYGHMLIMFVVLSCAIVAVYAVHPVGLNDSTPWLKWGHAQIGCICLFLFLAQASFGLLFLYVSSQILILQLIVGFVIKLFPGASPPLASRYRPMHRFWGMVVFVAAVAAAVAGAAHVTARHANDSTWATAATLNNMFIVFACVFCVFVVGILTESAFVRPDDPSHRDSLHSDLGDHMDAGTLGYVYEEIGSKSPLLKQTKTPYQTFDERLEAAGGAKSASDGKGRRHKHRASSSSSDSAAELETASDKRAKSAITTTPKLHGGGDNGGEQQHPSPPTQGSGEMKHSSIEQDDQPSKGSSARSSLKESDANRGSYRGREKEHTKGTLYL